MLNGIILNMDKMNIYRGLKYAYGFFLQMWKRTSCWKTGEKNNQVSLSKKAMLKRQRGNGIDKGRDWTNDE